MLDGLLECDHVNAVESQKGLAAFDLRLPGVIEAVGQFHRTYLRAFRHEITDEREGDVMTRIKVHLNNDSHEGLQSFLNRPPPDDPESRGHYEAGRAAMVNGLSKRVRSILMVLNLRSFLWGLSDIMKLRLSQGMGLLRVQIESAGLMKLFFDAPTEAERWLNINTDDDGKRFNMDHAKALAEFRKRHQLEGAWNRSSATAQHARFGSIVYSLGNEFFEEFEKGHIKIVFQESLEDEGNFVLNVLHFLRIQEKLFRAYSEAVPEVTDGVVVESRLNQLSSDVSAMWSEFDKRYPAYKNKQLDLERRGGEA